MSQPSTAQDRVDLSTDTQVKWIEDAFYVRPHWWSIRKRMKGTWFSTHVRFPGANGCGDTIEASLDDLAECMREWTTVVAEVRNGT